MKVLVYEGNTVRLRERTGSVPDMLCLTDMWKAGGSPENKDPPQWRRLDFVEGFTQAVRMANMGVAHVWQSQPGNQGGTWAHWQIGFAYAKYLSHEFHMWCNEVVRDHINRGSAAIPNDAILKSIRELANEFNDKHSDSIELSKKILDVLDTRLPVHKHEFSPRWKWQARQVVLHDFGGKDPLGSDVLIVTAASEPNENWAIDHWYARNRTGRFDGVPTTREHNERLKNSQYRARRETEARYFWRKLEERFPDPLEWGERPKPKPPMLPRIRVQRGRDDRTGDLF